MLGGWELVALGAVVGVGALVQGSIGFGFALVSAPVFALVQPDLVPSVLLMLALPISVIVRARERAHVHTRGAVAMIAGMVPGVALGVLVLRVLPADLLTTVFGAAIVLAVAASVAHPHAAPGDAPALAGGLASGLVGTVAATGGPFIALLYQRRPGSELRATLATVFFVAGVLALAGQAVAGRLGAEHVRVSAALLPALGVGLWASGRTRAFLDVRWLRPAVLVFSAASGLGAIAKGLL